MKLIREGVENAALPDSIADELTKHLQWRRARISMRTIIVLGLNSEEGIAFMERIWASQFMIAKIADLYEEIQRGK
jgi:hypothetical protein